MFTGFDATFIACAVCYVLLALVASVAKTPPPEDGDDGAARGIVGDELGDEIPLPGNDEDGGGGADGTDNRRAGDLSQTGDPSSSGDPSGRGDASSTAVPLVVLVPMVAYMGLNVAGEVTFGSWIFTVARAREGLSVSTAAALTSTFWACFTATRFALGLIPDLRPLTALAWSHVAALSALATLAMYWSGSVDATSLTPDLERKLAFLNGEGVDTVAHTGNGKFDAHLIGVASVLKAWGCDQSVVSFILIYIFSFS